MTLHEIEETLHELQSRHEGLNEGMLVTLLRSGGWEEKNIQEAVLLFRSGSGTAKPETVTAAPKTLPPLQTEPALPPEADAEHLLLDHNVETKEDPAKQAVAEPQSLVEPPSEAVQPHKEELPHNLPLRPFETSDHVWPFSRYRDVFYGEADTKTRSEGIKEETPPPPSIFAEPVTEKKEAAGESPPIIMAPAAREKGLSHVPLTKGDEKLVLTAAVMLVAVLLLLGYMYSNGRL